MSEMPWWAMKYDLRDLNNTLSDKYGVSGIPHLACMNTNGTIVSNTFRGDITSKKAEALNELV